MSIGGENIEITCKKVQIGPSIGIDRRKYRCEGVDMQELIDQIVTHMGAWQILDKIDFREVSNYVRDGNDPA